MLGDDGKCRVSRWFGASLLLFVLATAAIFLLWRAGPFAPGFMLPEEEATRWHLHDWVWLLSCIGNPLGRDLRGNWIGEVKTWG